MGKSAGHEEPSTTFLDKRETQLSEMGKISFCMIATALVVSLGPNAEVKAKKRRKPSGFPGDLAKCNVKGKWERDDPLKKIEETVIENGEKLDELIKGVSGEKKCAMVVLGDAYSGFQQTSFSPYHVVTNEEDWYNDLGDGIVESNYWITSDEKTGDEARLYMAYRCATIIKGFLIKNAKGNDDRGAKDFTISISDSIQGPWTDILTGTLPDARNVSPVPVLNFELENEVVTKVVRFQVDSFFQWGGGLQYFSTY